MTLPRRPLLRRLKLRYVLFLALLLPGILPLVISSVLLIHNNQEIFQNSERDYLTQKAGALSRRVDEFLGFHRRQLAQLGRGVLAPAGPAAPAERLREPWLDGYVKQFLGDARDLVALQIVDASGQGPGALPQRGLNQAERQALEAATALARKGQPAYRFATGPAGEPIAAVAVPASAPGKGQLVARALVQLRPIQEAFENEPRREVGIFLIDGQGNLLWRDGNRQVVEALHRSALVKQFIRRPLSSVQDYEVKVGDREIPLVVQASPINESGWGLVVEKPLSVAFATVDEMVFNTVLSTLLLVGLAFLFAFAAARRVSQPIQRLADTTHEIAAGNFGRRVEIGGLGYELSELAEDFNRMSGHLESHVQQLRQAAQANRELFIGSLRAFVAAVDAKDPYTRGHSERVAALSRTIARQLVLPEEIQHKVWIGALLHDVGKIGIEDRILRKSGVLTPEEYEQMKLHTVMGADILSRIEQLKEVIPAVRWHHEAWNGRGYPDGLKGEQIPIFARIVAVADCFDAITTNRPYQQAYSLQFAVETITKLTGSRFDAKVVTAFLRAYEAGEVRVVPTRPMPAADQPAPEAPLDGAPAETSETTVQ
ncbi:MAG TPA: HD domain-containing phosphohydrolase [Thermoanaerobaculia bacterium]|nr:HD domain-containing phosphohydrolase [Thermoanaerobaculia bacterium]